MKAIAIAMWLCLLLASGCGTAAGPAATTSAITASQGTSVTDITMPQPGSPNIPIYRALGWDNVYVVYWLQIRDGWAYIHAIPFTSTDGPTIDTRALLRQSAVGEWRVLEKSTTEGLLTDVGAVAEDQDVPEQFKSKHPDAPAAVFPEAKPGDKLIMDAIRASLGNPQYRFNVFVLNEKDGWAYAEVRGLMYRAGRISESREARVLLRNTNGAWLVQQTEDMKGTSQGDFVAGLKARFPDIPMGVLP
jgi:hypothetical protein